MTFKLPPPTKLTGVPLTDDLYIPLGFKHSLIKSMIDPIKRSGKPKDFSAIIFGPPGTGKTSIIRSVAKEVGWKLIEIGPHDLAKHPESVEQAVVECFHAVRRYAERKSSPGGHKKARTVFVFDEIDTLVESRRPEAGRSTNFITTVMLPLLQELRDLAEERGIVFFVLTNHIERFDPAVKRKGRFDLILPLGLPDHQARFMWFRKCMEDLKERYMREYNVKLLTEYEVGAGGGQGPPDPVLASVTNYDVLARASYRLSFSDIKVVCDRVVDRRISIRPSLRDRAPQTEGVLIFTSNFIDWINKYRSPDPTTRDEIDRFYRDADTYSRGAYPYAYHNTLQERMDNEFSSLVIEHNLSEIGRLRAGRAEKVSFCIINLSEFGVFDGSVSLEISLGGRTVKSLESRVYVIPGRWSEKRSLTFTLPKAGMARATFTIQGAFLLRGGETVLDQNRAELSGKVVYQREIRVL